MLGCSRIIFFICVWIIKRGIGDARDDSSNWLTDHTRCMCTLSELSTPIFIKLNPHLQSGSSLMSVTTQCAELLPRYAQYFGHYLTLFLPSYRKVYRRNWALHLLCWRTSSSNPSTRKPSFRRCSKESVPDTIRVRPVRAFRQELDAQSTNL